MNHLAYGPAREQTGEMQFGRRRRVVHHFLNRPPSLDEARGNLSTQSIQCCFQNLLPPMDNEVSSSESAICVGLPFA
jgi:hypothetical protein